MSEPFKILSIDGGGIRGVFPAKLLMDLELLAGRNRKKPLHEYFDLICGTSTGGIIALAVALGLPAQNIYQLYLDNAGDIFGKRRAFWKQWGHARYDRLPLETLLRKTFLLPDGRDARLMDCKTRVCIPVYDLMEGKPSVLKNNYHPEFVRDYPMPAYQVALATAAAPVYFNPYSSHYPGADHKTENMVNKVDGGVFANNPALVGIVEAQTVLKVDLKDLRVLSIGTGHQKFRDARDRKGWGLGYWLSGVRLMELFLQGQSQQVQNLISLLHKGGGGAEEENFIYHRIDAELDASCRIRMDATDRRMLDILSEKAHIAFQNNASKVLQAFFEE